MYSLNRIKLVGYLTEKAELKQLPSGTSVCDLNLRVISKTEKSDGGTFDNNSFHTVTCWSGMAETVAQYTDQGSQVYIEGRLKTESWDGEDGRKRYKTKVIADNLILLTPRDGLYPAISGNNIIGSGVNEVEILGNLTKDLEVRQTPNGTTVGSTSLATNRRWRDRNTGDNQEEVEYHNLVIWDKLAEEGEKFLKKGQKIYASGRLQNRSWDTPEGEKRYITEIVIEKISLMGREMPESGGNSEYIPQENTSESKPSSNPVSVQESPEIPAIEYESDIKPEDLPF